VSIWSGHKDRGSKQYTPEQYEAVRRVLAECRGPRQATTQKHISELTRVPSRTVREIISDLDGGDDGVVAYTGGTYGGGSTGDERAVYFAVVVEEAEAYTRRLQAERDSRQERIERREAATRRLPRHQGGLFP